MEHLGAPSRPFFQTIFNISEQHVASDSSEIAGFYIRPINSSDSRARKKFLTQKNENSEKIMYQDNLLISCFDAKEVTHKLLKNLKELHYSCSIWSALTINPGLQEFWNLGRFEYPTYDTVKCHMFEKVFSS